MQRKLFSRTAGRVRTRRRREPAMMRCGYGRAVFVIDGNGIVRRFSNVGSHESCRLWTRGRWWRFKDQKSCGADYVGVGNRICLDSIMFLGTSDSWACVGSKRCLQPTRCFAPFLASNQTQVSKFLSLPHARFTVCPSHQPLQRVTRNHRSSVPVPPPLLVRC